MTRRLGPCVLVMVLILSGCVGDKETDPIDITSSAPLDISTTPENEHGNELHELVVLLRDELAKKETRIAKLERALDTCEADLRAMNEITPAGGTGAPLLELPRELELRKLSIVDPEGRAVLTFEERSGKAFMSVAQGARTIGPVALDPILSLLAPLAEAGALGLSPETILSDMVARPKDKGIAVPPEFSTWIRKTGPYEYMILSSGLDAQISDMETLARQARIIPYYREGMVRGFKLVGVRPGSLYRAIGIRSGDVIMTVNGDAITSPAHALDLFNALQDAKTIVVGIERRRKELTLTYHVVEAFPGIETPTAEPDSPEAVETPPAVEAPPAEAPAPVDDDVDAPIEKTHEVPKIFS